MRTRAVPPGERREHGEERLMPRSLYAPEAPSLTRDAAKALADRILGMSKADQLRVEIRSEWTGNTRFARAEITTSGGGVDTTINVVATVGRRRATATTNITDDDSLRRTVELAEQLARLSPEDPELMPELGPQTYVNVPAYFESTAGLAPESCAAAAKKVIDTAVDTGR